MNSPSSGRQALQWLGRASTGASGGILRQAQDLARLQSDIDTWSANTRLRLQAGPIKQGVLRLYSDHPAMLARARQQLPSLQGWLNTRGWHLEKLDLKVRSSPLEPVKDTRPKRGRFPEKVSQNWVELLDNLHDERLKAATRRLCERNGWKSGD